MVVRHRLGSSGGVMPAEGEQRYASKWRSSLQSIKQIRLDAARLGESIMPRPPAARRASTSSCYDPDRRAKYTREACRACSLR